MGNDLLQGLKGRDLALGIDRMMNMAARHGWVDQVIIPQPWNWPQTMYATITFNNARRTSEAVFKPLIELGKEFKFHRAFWIAESHVDWHQGLHAHGLFELKNSSDLELVNKSAGRLGNVKIEPAKSPKAAAIYICKNLGSNSIPYMFPHRPEMWGLRDENSF